MGFFKRVYNKGISLLDRLIGKVHLFLEKKNVVKPIVDSIYRKYENEEPVKHKYPVNYRDSDKTLFDHYTNYGTFPETVYSYQKVFVTNKGVVFKRWNNVRFSFPHSVFRETFGWLYILKQYTLVKRCYLPTHITYVLLFDFWSAANYYHWLVDSLPRLFGVKDLVAQPGFSLLLPANCPDFILRCLAHFEINEITFLKKNEYYSVDKLLLPYYLAGSGHIHPPRVFEVKQFFASKIPLEDKQDRIYVSRARQKARKVINEDEIIAVLNEFDFKIIYFEDYNFEEQLKIAGKASVMISSHGANLTNSLFMPENACVLELIRKDNPNFCYWALANASRINYYYQLCDVKGHDHLVVDISLFRENLQKMLNG
jgi:hypothetical protein